MHLAWMELVDFRSYETLRFEPAPGVNILSGQNGAGKTSILEAIGYLGTTKSFRGVPDRALIREESTSSIVRGGVGGGPSEITIEAEILAEGRRTFLINGKAPKRLHDVSLLVPLVVFLPDDLDLVKRGPAKRREYLDDLSSRLWPQASQDLSEYDRSLRQRNALLRHGGRSTDLVTLGVWDDRLASAGSRVLLHRRSIAVALQPHLYRAYREVGGEGSVEWFYRSTWNSQSASDLAALQDSLLAALSESRKKDMDVRATTVGPHRDEPGLLLDGRPTRTQASQGEQRTVALALRIGAYQLMEELLYRKPILLLDDVFSELDEERVQRILPLIEDGQVFVTTTRDDDLPIQGRRWSVEEGSVR